ncbi:Ger(x)C family spore germination protein [Paenibacillus sp.]|uniref:Ger(x)C family spore germination protein n=1 Tax=Paenibacillus sp. TaxID=58172 RepID=UPI002D5BBE60|nr:Ger(x)C family spore germination C-terminal domain-containing protein [Paenibacillus sp.]HZG57108.1 Ger(x)C family spore germination C-terminal domain-containing protein [Paenibacillus sp.]
MNSQRIEFFLRAAIVLSLLLFAGGGFNGYKDIDKRFFVVSMGVDEGKNGMPFEVTLKLAIPQPDPKAGKNDFLLLTREAHTIGAAVAFMKSQVDKEFDFGHMKLVVIGDSLAKRDWMETMDWFFRRRDIQKVAFVAVGRPDAKTILQVKPMFENLPSNAYFLAFGDEGTESPYVVTEYLFDLLRRFQERGIDPVVPIIEPFKEQFEIQKAYVTARAGTKLQLDLKETGLYSILLQRTARATLSTLRGDDSFSVTADEIRVRYELKDDADKPYIAIRGDIVGVLETVDQSVEPNELERYERGLEKQLNEDMIAFVRKLQREQVDPIGFGLRYRATHWNNDTEWEEWKGLYPKLDVRSDIRVILETTGVIE